MTTEHHNLIQQAQAGKRESQAQLLEHYRRYLMFLTRLQVDDALRAKIDPQDIVQETLLEANRDFSSFHGTTEFEIIGWLRSILAHNIANHVRAFLGTQKRNIRLERELKIDLDHSSQAIDRALIANDTSPSHKLMRRENSVLIAEALEQLPDDYREVLVLRHLEDLKISEVAARMDRSLDSVKNLWARATARFRRILGDSL